MAVLSMYVSEAADGGICVNYYCDDSEFDGNDFSRTYLFSQKDSLLLAEKLNVELDIDSLQKAIDRSFGHNMYDRRFEEFCIRNGVHGQWHLREDYPGGISENGEF